MASLCVCEIGGMRLICGNFINNKRFFFWWREGSFYSSLGSPIQSLTFWSYYCLCEGIFARWKKERNNKQHSNTIKDNKKRIWIHLTNLNAAAMHTPCFFFILVCFVRNNIFTLAIRMEFLHWYKMQTYIWNVFCQRCAKC